jgi:hypothetical protein
VHCRSFITFIGLQSSNGIGAITFDPATLVTLGGLLLLLRF